MSRNPAFMRPTEQERRQTLWQRVTQFTRREVKEAEDVVAAANRFLAWDNMPYSDEFKTWLREQSSQPAEVTDHLTMVGQAARAQAYLEVLRFLQEQRLRATIATGAANE